MTEPRTSGTKTCRDCGEEKHVLCFGTRRDRDDGLSNACRDCRSGGGETTDKSGRYRLPFL